MRIQKCIRGIEDLVEVLERNSKCNAVTKSDKLVTSISTLGRTAPCSEPDAIVRPINPPENAADLETLLVQFKNKSSYVSVE